jgi:tetratricopeptide (TPR) repeat protein
MLRLAKPLLVGLLCFSLSAPARPQAKSSPDSSFARGLRNYKAGQWGPAVQDLQEAAKVDPSNIYAQFYLGQALFKQHKYEETVGPYERLLELDKGSKKLDETQRRIVTDQLAMAYGISGDLKKTHTLLEEAIRGDPQYPMNYYNLACAFAQEGDRGQALASLAAAFQHKNNAVKGDPLPDPRRDDSFKTYLRDADFIALMRASGLDENTDPEDE